MAKRANMLRRSLADRVGQTVGADVVAAELDDHKSGCYVDYELHNFMGYWMD